MILKDGVILAGLNIKMRPALIALEKVYKRLGRSEGVTITSGLDGVHSAGSLHYYGLAVDGRTHYFTEEEIDRAVAQLKNELGNNYDVVKESTHIHIEYDPKY